MGKKAGESGMRKYAPAAVIFATATIHYAVANIFGPPLFGRGAGLRAEGQQGFLQVHMPCHSVFKAHELLRRLPRAVRQGQVRLLRGPMDVDETDDSRRRKNGTECILCMECVRACPKKAL